MAAKVSKKKTKRGGVRPGAGRPAKPEAYATPVKDAERRVCDRLPQLIDNMFRLAMGGYRRVEREYERKGDRMVCTRRKFTIAEPDRAANQYLIDRVMGKPTTPIEHGSGETGPLRIVVEYADTAPPSE